MADLTPAEQAAHAAICETSGPEECAEWSGGPCVKAVRAARPHIAAETLREAARTLAVDLAEPLVAIPARVRAVPVDVLMERSWEIEGGAS